MVKKVLIFGILLTLSLVTNLASATPIDEAWKAYDSGNYNKAAELFRHLQPITGKASGALCMMAVLKRAVSSPEEDLKSCKDGLAQNDPASFLAMGWAHLYGSDWLDVQVDQKIGLGYLGNSVSLGFKMADDYLCTFYYTSNVYSKATPFCKIAAHAGLPDGLYHLALMHIDGHGVVQDYKEAKQLALLSASLNNSHAFKLLGDIAKNKKYGNPKIETAYAWYSLATASAPDWEEPKLAREQLNLNQTQTEEAQAIASAWKLKSPPKWRDLY